MDEPKTPAELLLAWRDATRAARLADRLTAEATEAVHEAEDRAVGTEAIAALAQETADAASRTAERAALVAREAADWAQTLQGREDVAEVDATALHQEESDAKAAHETASDR